MFFESDESNTLANHLRKCSPTVDDTHGIVQRLWLYTEYYIIKFQVYYSKLTSDVRRMKCFLSMSMKLYFLDVKKNQTRL